MTRRMAIAPLVYVTLLMTPVYWLVTMSLKDNSEIMGRFTLFPHDPSFSSFAIMFSDSAWYIGYVNALIYVAINVVISVSVAIPAAYAFSRYRFPGHRQLFFGFLMFRMMAPAILLVPFVQLASDLSIFDTHVAVAIAHCFFNVPLAIWILEGFIAAVPRELDESARIDGYGFARSSSVSFCLRLLQESPSQRSSVSCFPGWSSSSPTPSLPLTQSRLAG